MVAKTTFQPFARHFLLRRFHGHRFRARHDGKCSALNLAQANSSIKTSPLDGGVLVLTLTSVRTRTLPEF